jgi:hypothetical protein
MAEGVAAPAPVAVPAAPIVPPMPAAPRLGACVRAAATDLYYNSWRLVPMNLLWGVMLLAIIMLAGAWSAVALLALPVLALPLAGLADMSGRIVRERAVSLSDGFAAWRRLLVPALGLGAGILLATAVLAVNIAIGFGDGGLVQVAIATLAAWGLVALAALAVVAWPLLADPAREDAAPRDRLRLAGVLVVAHPVRVLALTALVVAFLAVSTAAFAALLTVSVAFASQMAARYVLPAADRLETRLAANGAGEG